MLHKASATTDNILVLTSMACSGCGPGGEPIGTGRIREDCAGSGLVHSVRSERTDWTSHVFSSAGMARNASLAVEE
jgi:hypothetical protein